MSIQEAERGFGPKLHIANIFNRTVKALSLAFLGKRRSDLAGGYPIINIEGSCSLFVYESFPVFESDLPWRIKKNMKENVHFTYGDKELKFLDISRRMM